MLKKIMMLKKIIMLLVLLFILMGLGGCSMYGVSVQEIRLYKQGFLTIFKHDF